MSLTVGLWTKAEHATGEAAAGALGAMPEWDLSDLYPSPDSAELAADIAKAKAMAAKFQARYAGKLEGLAKGKDGGAKLASAVRDYEALSDTLGRIASYASLVFAADTASAEVVKFYGDIQETLNAISGDGIFFTLELNRIDDAVMEACLAVPALAHYRPWIEDVRRERPYQLSDEAEKLFHETSVVARGAWSRLFSETLISLRFEVGGKSLGLEAALNGFLSADEGQRRASAEALAKVFSDNRRLFTTITNTLAKEKEISDRWRGFKDVADSRHLANVVEREVVEALVAAVRARYPKLSQRYYALKARWLGKPKLEYWDRNAPLPEEDTRLVPWDEARAIVLDAYAGFSPRMATIAGQFFDHGWIDAPQRDNKSTGAFAHPTVPSAHPYILLNYQGRSRDVMTLAHELGHGVHQVLANVQGPLMAPTPLTLAETASVFGEMLTFQKILAATTDARARKALLASKVEDMINTVVRQIAFYQFERSLHLARRDGELTADQIGAMWLDVQRESLGDAVHLSDGYQNYWCYVPHFIYSPFYVYAYAFGDCLVNSLYARYQQSADGFAEKYFALLAAGGTRHHREALAPFQLDATEPKFWDMGLDVIEAMIDQLEALDRAG